MLGVAAGAAGRVRGDLRARALPVRGRSGTATAEERLVVGYGATRPARHAGAMPPIDLPMDVLFGKAPKMHRDTAHPPAPRWPALQTGTAWTCTTPALRVLAHPDGRVQAVPGHHRRPQRRRPDRARPDGRPVAAAGGRLRDHAVPASTASPAKRWRSANARRWRCSMPPPPRAWRWARRSPTCAPRRWNRWTASSCRPTGWPRPATPARTRCCSTRCKAVGMELCPELDLSIPVGKDSLSMQAQWQADGAGAEVGVAGVADRHRLRAGGRRARATDAAAGARGRQRAVADRPGRRQAAPGRLGAGAVPSAAGATARCRRSPATSDDSVPDLDDPQRLRDFFELIRDAREAGLLLAYHDRCDGGAFAALCEMAFASHRGLDIDLDGWGDDAVPHAVQRGTGRGRAGRRPRTAPRSPTWSTRHGLTECAQRIAPARPTAPVIRVQQDGDVLAEWRWDELFDAWWSVTPRDAEAARQPRVRRRGARSRARLRRARA